MSNKGYEPTIGLEIHAELKTLTKMFCSCRNNPDETRPNWNICPICMGHPGTLPVMNKEAIKHVLKVGIALQGELADFTEFDRKNYFYPDIPKGYQISQYKNPLVKGGVLNNVKITRIHLEEDTATSLHEKGGCSLIDFNRAGVPLMELVTEPVIKNGKDAAQFGRELQLILRYLGVSDANMEKGEMRVEANISVSPEDGEKKGPLGTKVEVKNLNSFRAVERAILYECDRQITLLESGEKVIQETRGWDEGKQKTFSQREKEESHDYRYFSEPDLPKLYLGKLPWAKKDALKKELPELPREKRARLNKKFGIKSADVEIFVQNKKLSELFEKVAEKMPKDNKMFTLAANYITSDLAGLIGSEEASLKFSPEDYAELIQMISRGSLSSRGAKDILAKMFKDGGKPSEIAEQEGLVQKTDEKELKLIVESVIASNKKVAEDYKKGKGAALQFLIGQGMKATKGAANPNTLRKIFLEFLK